MGLSRIPALLVLSVGVAVAQPKPTPPTTQQKAEIERLAKQAIAKSQKGDHEGAIKDYLEAYAISPVTVLLSNIGHEFKTIKKPYEALKYFCMYLEKEPTGSAANYVLAEASSIWKELGRKEGEVCVTKPEPPPDPKPPIPDPNAGQVTGTANPPTPTPKPSGGGGGLRMAGLGVAGAGVVVLGAGLFFGVKAQQKGDEITAGPPIDPATGMPIGWGPNPDFPEWDGIVKLEADGESLQTKQIAFTAIGGAMIIGGTALYFLGRSKKSGTTEVRVSATAAPGAAGFLLNGRF
jgi:hypothetical protein